MSMKKWLLPSAASLCAAFALMLPTQASAQSSLMGELFGWIFNVPRWSVDAHGGYGYYGRFLLQNPTNDPFSLLQRELRGRHAWTVGLGVGGMVLPRSGFRLGADYTWSDLDWRDDTGNDSHLLDFDDAGNLKQFMLTAEFMRFLFPESRRVNPYASAGFLASWYKLTDEFTVLVVDDEEEAFVGLAAPGGNSQFRWGATGSLGLQFRVSEAFRLRLGANRGTISNPFTGRQSFIAVNGLTIDEPSRVGKTDYRLSLVYSFGKAEAPTTTNGGKGSR